MAPTAPFPATLVVTNDFPPRAGGVERFVFDLVDHLPADRLRVIAPSQPGDAAFDRGLAFPVTRVRRGRVRPSAELRAALAAELHDHRPDVVLFGHALPQVALATDQVAAAGVPFATLTHGVEYWVARLPGVRRLLARVTAGAGRVFTISAFVEGPIRRAVAPGVRVERLSPGVDTRRFRPDVDGRPVRQLLGLGDRPTILCVGRFVPRKGQDVLVAAMPRVLEAVPDARLVLAGDGPYRRRVAALAAAATPPGTVVLPGSVPDAHLPALYAACDVFATPCRSRWGGLEVEGFGIVFLEAAAAGKPSVAGRSGGAAEAVVDGATGLVVDGRNDREVADALIALLTDPDRARAIGTGGRERAEGEHDLRAVAARLGQHIRDVADGR
ncbi:MAG TPA: glycosyltransferase family 4 protein [Actinomycetota bacterium]